jgi:hypothetical protein
MIGYYITIHFKSGGTMRFWTASESVRDICINELSEDLGTDKRWLWNCEVNHSKDHVVFLNGAEVVAYEVKTAPLTALLNLFRKKKND